MNSLPTDRGLYKPIPFDQPEFYTILLKAFLTWNLVSKSQINVAFSLCFDFNSVLQLLIDDDIVVMLSLTLLR